MAKFQILYWKDIPALVRVFEGKRAISRQMPNRFQTDIDRIAMREGLAGTDEYLNHWQWSEKRERPGDAGDILNALLQELEVEYDRHRLKAH